MYVVLELSSDATRYFTLTPAQDRESVLSLFYERCAALFWNSDLSSRESLRLSSIDTPPPCAPVGVFRRITGDTCGSSKPPRAARLPGMPGRRL